MSEPNTAATPATQAATATDALGVVDPMRIPGVVRVRAWWDGMPALARAFVVLALADVVVRALGLFGTSLRIDLADPLSVITAFLPHDALILLPAVVVLRRPDALTAAPLVTRGAVAVALSELLSQPLRGLTGNPIDPFTGPTVVFIAAEIATAAGWLAIAAGLRRLDPPQIDINAGSLANLVAGALAVNALIALAQGLTQPIDEFAAVGAGTLFKIAGVVSTLGGLAFATFAWSVIRGRGDARRPKQALDVAVVALALIAAGSLLITLMSLVALALAGLSSLVTGVLLVLSLLIGPVAMTALVAAFGLGLADPSGTIEPVRTEANPAPTDAQPTPAA